MRTKAKAATRVWDIVVVPMVSDEIEVCWKNEDGSLQWWRASIVSSKASRKGRIFGVGSIRYHDQGQYADTIYEVDFIYDKYHGTLLKERRKSKLNECAWRRPSVPCDTATKSDQDDEDFNLSEREVCDSEKNSNKDATGSS